MVTEPTNPALVPETLHQVFENSPYGIAIISKGKFEAVNQQFCSYFAYENRNIAGYPIKSVFRDKDEYLKIEHLESFEISREYKGLPQPTRYSIRTIPIFDKDVKNKVLIFASEIKRPQKELDEEEINDLSSAFNLSPSILLLLDEDTNIININDTALRIAESSRIKTMGLQPGDVLQCIRSYDSPDGCGKGPHCKKCIVRSTVLETLLTGKNNIKVESPFSFKAGKEIVNLTVLVSSLIIKRNNQRAVLVAIDDITERKEIENSLIRKKQELKLKNNELKSVNTKLLDSFNRIKNMNVELQQEKERAEESDNLKSAFLSNISHEIRTPMNGILGFVELLNEITPTPEQRKSYTRTINQSADQLLHIVNDILEISRIETGQVEIATSKIAVDDLLSNLLSHYELIAKDKNLSLIFKPEKNDTPVCLECDENKLKHILKNLIDNALKFTSEGRVEFGYKTNDETIEFFVKDSGIGIEESLQNKIFEGFRQAELSDSREYGGMGLGLAIAKAYVKLFRGHIWLESNYGVGSIFYFTIPWNQNKVNTLNSENYSKKHMDLSDKTILIVEDEEISTLLLDEVLKPTGANLLFATNASEAIEICRTNTSLSLVLMDIKLPDKSGYYATREIKSMRKQLPVIAQTAYAMSTDKKKAIEAGCDGYITKPIQRNELEQLLTYHLA